MPVNITIACIHCHKQYSISDSMIGKRVKCMGCGEVFTATRQLEETVAFSAIEALEPEETVPPPIVAAASRSRMPVAPSFTGTAVDSVPIMYVPPIQRTRRGRVSNPLDDLIHDKLPLFLILVGIFIPAVISFVQLVRLHPQWRAVVAYFLLLIGYVGIVIPCTVIGLRIAARVMDFELVDSPGYRVVAAFAASWIVLFLYGLFFPLKLSPDRAIEVQIAAIITWLLTGLLVSVLASFELLKLFFGLRWGEAIVAWLFASASYILGSVASILTVALILWLVNQVIASTEPAIQKTASDSISATPTSPDQVPANARELTAQNLHQFGLGLIMYHNDHHSYPMTLDMLIRAETLTPDLMKSPFGPSGGPDYVYTMFPVPNEESGHVFIAAYDAAEGPTDQGMTVLRGDGTTEFLGLDDFTKALAASKNYTTTEYQKYSADLVARQTPPPPAADVSPLPPPIEPVSSPAPEPTNPIAPVGDTPLPLHAWTAEADPPVEAPHINPRLRHVFGAAGVFYFAPQPSDFVYVSRHDPTDKIADKYPDELWNLKTLVKVGEYPCIQVAGGAVLSASGKYFAIRSLGGQDLATAYQIYSTHTGKLEHTLNGPPMVGKLMPTPIGFVGDDKLVTLGDDFDVWNIRQETGLHHFGDRTKIDDTTLAAISPTGKFVATLCGGETLALYSTDSGKFLGQTPLPDAAERKSEPASALRALAFSPDGGELALFLNGQHLYVWSVADGSLSGRFVLKTPIESTAKVDGSVDTMVWAPDSQGWLLGGNHLVDRVTGVGIYKTPDYTERGADEIGQRQITDDGHILLGYQAGKGGRVALETLGIDTAVIEKNRASMRALVGPATQGSQ